MANFLFWNVGGEQRADLIGQLAAEHRVDVLLLAESMEADSAVLGALNAVTGRRFCKPWTSTKGKVQIYTSYDTSQIRAVLDDNTGRLTIRRLVTDRSELLIAAVHLPSKYNWEDGDQDSAAGLLAQQIAEIEDDRGHQRTVVIGDFNMNPFQRGVCSCHGFHAVMTKQIAAERLRKVADREWRLFYNPMWGHFGDRTEGPAGTHFYRTGKPLLYFWNIFDQVLLRPDILPWFDGNVRIIDSVGSRALLNAREQPDPTIGSDHLPLWFRLDVP